MDWLCFNTDANSDSSEEQDYSLRYICERFYPHAISSGDQPQSLCQSICNFFKKCLCCGWCIGGFDNEHQQPGANPVAENLIQNAAGDQPHSLCQSIWDSFKKCLCCGCCIGGFNNEHQQPGANPVAEPPCLSIWSMLLMFFGRRTDEGED